MPTALRSRARWHPLALLVALALLLSSLLIVSAAPSGAAGELYPVPASGSWAVEGAGFGHGRGLSQWGAQGAALDGLRPDQILNFYYPGTNLQQQGNPNVRVQLTAYQGNQIVFGPYGSETITAVDKGDGKSMALPAASRYRLTIDATWMHLEMRNGSTWQPIAMNGLTDFGGPIELTAPNGVWLYSADLSGSGRQYFGLTRFVRTSATNAQAVNVLPFDSYLKFVVPRESPSYFHGNALQAQAIAARSYARSVMSSRGEWDICDTTQCQVYGGRAVADAGTGKVTWLETTATSQAVDYTAGLILMEPGGAPAFTQYSASNGGHMVAGSKPYLVAKPDPYSGKAPNDPASRWKNTLQASTLQAQCDKGGTLQSFEILERDGKGPFGGRITRLRVNCTGGSTDITSASTLKFNMLHHMWKPTAAPSTGGGGGAPGGGATIGNLEAVTTSNGGIRIKGWASGPTGATAAITIVYFTNQHRTVQADDSRPDVGKAYPALGPNHGFNFVSASPAGATLTCVWADAEGSRLMLGCANVTVPSGAPFGAVDDVAAVAGDGTNGPGLVVRGWVIDPNTNGPIDVHVYWNNGAVPITANQSRPDVGNLYPSAGPNHGFSTRVNAPAGSSGELCVYAINQPAPADNPIMGCRLYTVPG